MSLSGGSRLDPYEILGAIGAGGMGFIGAEAAQSEGSHAIW